MWGLSLKVVRTVVALEEVSLAEDTIDFLSEQPAKSTRSVAEYHHSGMMLWSQKEGAYV